jgi:hypothetical protein
MNTNFLNILRTAFSIAALTIIVSCDDDEPKKEDTPELITKVTLTFTPTTGGAPVVVTATDPDGEGVQDISPDGPVTLAVNESYTLAITLINGLAAPSEPGYDITEEVQEESDEHLFFFGWTNNVFSEPAGNGNIDNRSDDVNYEDEDANALPLGLQTSWIAADVSSGNFHVILKHQPGLKSATSTSSTGETDLDLTFTINIE